MGNIGHLWASLGNIGQHLRRFFLFKVNNALIDIGQTVYIIYVSMRIEWKNNHANRKSIWEATGPTKSKKSPNSDLRAVPCSDFNKTNTIVFVIKFYVYMHPYFFRFTNLTLTEKKRFKSFFFRFSRNCSVLRFCSDYLHSIRNRLNSICAYLEFSI